MFVVCLGLLAVGFGFVAAGGLWYSLVFAVMMFLTAAFGYVLQLGARHREANIVSRDDGPAVELRGSKLVFALLTGIVACLTLFFGMASADYLRAGPDVPAKQIRPPSAPRGGRALAKRHPPARLDVFLVPAVGRRHSRKGRDLPRRALRAGSRLGERALGAAAARAAVEGRQVAPDADDRDQLRDFAIDRALLFHFVQFYVDHPAARAELGTERGLRRARSGELR
ncbi:hypothetical protein [Amycolatopsis sp. YIM 10]|uniref:hypothetical protein n=1 Tax=Amycolatopsis sp. YIM 10 TaxID=2653857 RepID=UPI00128FEE09|nr:hypothetical protein [Amycolatopsis sp. YIM 10]